MKSILLIAMFWALPVAAGGLPSSEKNLEVGLGLKAQLLSLDRLPPERRAAEKKRLVFALGGVARVQARIMLAEAAAARGTLRTLLPGGEEAILLPGASDKAARRFEREYSGLISVYESGVAAFEGSAAKLLLLAELYRTWGRPDGGNAAGDVRAGVAHKKVSDLAMARNSKKGAKNPGGAVYVEVRPGASALGLARKYRVRYSEFLKLNEGLKGNPDRLLAFTRVRVR